MWKGFSRPGRWLLLIGFWAVFLPDRAPAEEPSAKPLVLHLQWNPQAQFAGYLMAQDKGFFREAGLEPLEIRWSGAGQSSLKALASGEADFCTAWLSTAIVARSQGEPLVHLAQVVRKSTMLLVAHRTSGIRVPEDLNGRRIGLWGGDFDVLPNAFFKKYQLHPEIVPQSSSIVPFLRKAVDVVSAMEYNEYHKLLQAGLREEDLQIFRLSEYGLDFPEDGLYTSETLRREHPEQCAALVEAVRRGWDYALAHEAETIAVVMTACQEAERRTNRTHQRWMLQVIGQALTPTSTHEGDPAVAWGQLSPETYATVAAFLAEQGLLAQVPAFDAFHQPPGPSRAAAIPSAH